MNSPLTLGYSHQKRPIPLFQFGVGPIPVLMLGGVHGDEVEATDCTRRFLELIQSGGFVLPKALTLSICPEVNPDGSASLRRTNFRNVDLNRNMPTRDWSGEFTNVRYYPGSAAGSEPESQVLVQAIETLKPKFILSMHSFHQAMVNYNGEFTREVSELMSAKNLLPPKGDIGYPTPGSLGTYAANERGIPTVTLEILRDQKLDEVWAQHREGLMVAMEWAGRLT